MQLNPGGRLAGGARETERLSHCSECNTLGDLTLTPSEGLPFFNILIRTCCHLGDRHRADQWLQHVVASGLRPDARTFQPFVNLCADVGDVESAHHYLATMSGMGVPPNSCALHALMKAYAVSRDFVGTQRVMADMQQRGFPINEYAYHILLHACAKTGRLAEAEGYVAEMDRIGIEPTVTTYNCMINVSTRCDSMTRAQMWFQRMIERGIEPNAVTYGTLCKAYAAIGDVESVEEVMKTCEANGRPLSIHFYASWLLACERARPRKKDNAERCFQVMIQRKIATDSLFKRFVRLLGQKRAEDLRRASQEQSFNPDDNSVEACGGVTVLGCLSL